MPTRHMKSIEARFVDQFFLGTIPYSGIRITDVIGFQNRPYTICYPGVGEGPDLWHVNVGKQRYQGLETDVEGRKLLIHELTHVWQSAHSAWAPAYIFNSIWHQALEGSKAYDYNSGLPWNAYNVEQQAHIVEDWFAQGLQVTDPNFRYIRDNIRTAKKLR